MFDINSFMQWSEGLIATFGYFGIIVAAFIGTASVFLPTYPLSALIILAVAMKLNPVILAICAGIGSATGELIGYGVGVGSKKFLLEKHEKKIKKIEKMFIKYRGGFTIIFFSFLPIVPTDLMGMFSGTIGYSIKKFYIFCIIGKTLRYLTIALGTYYGINIVTGLTGYELPFQ